MRPSHVSAVVRNGIIGNGMFGFYILFSLVVGALLAALVFVISLVIF